MGEGGGNARHGSIFQVTASLLLANNYNYRPLNQPRRSSLMSHDQRARDCRLRVFLHLTVYSTDVVLEASASAQGGLEAVF